jgi:hypothetical protein
MAAMVLGIGQKELTIGMGGRAASPDLHPHGGERLIFAESRWFADALKGAFPEFLGNR